MDFEEEQKIHHLQRGWQKRLNSSVLKKIFSVELTGHTRCVVGWKMD